MRCWRGIKSNHLRWLICEVKKEYLLANWEEKGNGKRSGEDARLRRKSLRWSRNYIYNLLYIKCECRYPIHLHKCLHLTPFACASGNVQWDKMFLSRMRSTETMMLRKFDHAFLTIFSLPSPISLFKRVIERTGANRFDFNSFMNRFVKLLVNWPGPIRRK